MGTLNLCTTVATARRCAESLHFGRGVAAAQRAAAGGGYRRLGCGWLVYIEQLEEWRSPRLSWQLDGYRAVGGACQPARAVPCGVGQADVHRRRRDAARAD